MTALPAITGATDATVTEGQFKSWLTDLRAMIAETVGAVGGVADAPAGSVFRRNALYNGAFQVWQRGTAAVALTAATRIMLADRWGVVAAGASTATMQLSTGQRSDSLSQYSLQITGGAGVTTVNVSQRIEPGEIAPIARTITFQVWVENQTGAAFAPNFLIDTADALGNFSAVTNRLTQALQSCPDGQWTQVSHTVDISGYTNLANGAQLQIQIPSGSMVAGDVVRFAEAQIAAAALVTAFDVMTVAAAYGIYRVSGLKGVQNSGAPLTQYDVLADVVQLWDPKTARCLVATQSATLTNNISTGGPAANGRDQAGVFSASSWIYLYYIFDGTTLATITSAAAPPTGPVLPPGYTHWAFCGALFLNGSTQIVSMRMRGSRHYYTAGVSILSGGAATSETAIGMTGTIPPICSEMSIYVENSQLTTDGSGNAVANASLRVDTGTDYVKASNVSFAGLGVSSGIVASSGLQFWLPNLSQTLLYLWSITSGTSPLLNLHCLGFTVPNGDS